MPLQYLSKAPGRICLFGDHQDYLQLPVIACAIDRYIEIKAVPNDEAALIIRKLDLSEDDRIELDAPLDQVVNGDFLRLALKVVARYGCRPDRGFDIEISGNIPINAGLSSSSALTVAWIQFLVNAFGIDQPISPALLARLAYETEVIEQGSSGGKMDQYTISYGDLIFLATATDQVEQLPTPVPGLVIGVSGVAKDTFGTLASLKDRALQSIRQVQQKLPSFEIASTERAAITAVIEYIDAPLQKIFEAAVLNHELTRRAKVELQKNKLDCLAIGELMNAHHELLKKNLGITVPRIDAMIEAAHRAGALGAKIVGSGGGGCIVAMCSPGKESAVVEAILQAGAVDAFAVEQSPGATVLQRNC